MSDFLTSSSLDFLKLQVTIFTELSEEPTASTLELGWKEIDVIGASQNFYFTATVQHYDSIL